MKKEIAIQRVARILFPAEGKLSKDSQSIFNSLKEDQGIILRKDS